MNAAAMTLSIETGIATQEQRVEGVRVGHDDAFVQRRVGDLERVQGLRARDQAGHLRAAGSGWSVAAGRWRVNSTASRAVSIAPKVDAPIAPPIDRKN